MALRRQESLPKALCFGFFSFSSLSCTSSLYCPLVACIKYRHCLPCRSSVKTFRKRKLKTLLLVYLKYSLDVSQQFSKGHASSLQKGNLFWFRPTYFSCGCYPGSLRHFTQAITEAKPLSVLELKIQIIP